MKTLINRSLFGRNSKVSLVLAIAALLAIGLACGAKTPPPAQYVGFWTGADGTTITVRSDGSADYKSGGSSVSGGGAVIDDSAKTLKISLAGLGPTFKIDKAPTGNEMTLDGIVFTKAGGSSSISTSDSNSSSSSSNSSHNSTSNTNKSDDDDN